MFVSGKVSEATSGLSTATLEHCSGTVTQLNGQARLGLKHLTTFGRYGFSPAVAYLMM